MPIDLKATTAIPIAVRHALGLPASVKLYGAVGNGVTDDTAAIQAALDANVGGIVLLNQDTTYAVQNLEVPSGTSLTGYGATLHRITNGSHAMDAATIHNATTGDADITVEGVRFTTAVEGRHLGFDSVDGLVVRDCIVDGVSGVWATWFRDCTDVVVDGYRQNAGDDLGEDGLHFTGGSGITVTGCVIHSGDDCISLTSDTSDLAGNLSDVAISNCVLYSSDGRPICIDVSPTADDGSTIERVNISNCVGYANGTLVPGVSVVNQKPSTCFVRDVTITGCWFAQPNTSGTLDGLEVFDIERFTLAHSTLYDLGRHAVYLDAVTDAVLDTVRIVGNTHATGVGVLINESDHVRLTNCIIRDVQSHGIQLGSAAASDFCQIVGCLIDNPGGTAIQVEDSTGSKFERNKLSNASFGIGIAAGSANELVYNDTADAVGTPYSLAAGTYSALVTAEGGTHLPDDPEIVLLNDGDLAIAAGAPTRAVLAGTDSPVWALDAASDEGVAGKCRVPTTWSTFHVDLVWTNAGAGSGNVRWVPFYRQFSDTEAASAAATDPGAQTVAAPALAVVKTTRIASSVTRTDTIFSIVVYRDADDAADTLANDAGVMSIILTRAS